MNKLASLHHHHHKNPPYQNQQTQNPTTRLQKPSVSLSFTSSIQASIESINVSLLPHQSTDFAASFEALINGAKTLGHVRAMHGQMVKKCIVSDLVANALVSSYLELGDFTSAATFFLVGFVRNYAVWSSFLVEFKDSGGDPSRVLQVYGESCSKGVIFDSKVVTMMLKICTFMLDLWLGMEIHANLIKRGFELDVYVNAALMNFYATCLGVDSANQVFHELVYKDDLLWNDVIMINLKDNKYFEALELFKQMQILSAKADANVIVKLLLACRIVGAFDEGMQIHAYVLKNGMESNVSICNFLITLYSRSGKIVQARRVFDSMKDHNLSSWNSILSSYAAFGKLSEAWELFNKMEASNIKPDIITWNCLLSGHGSHESHKEVLSMLQKMQVAGFRPDSSSITSVLRSILELKVNRFGKEIHGYVARNGLDYDAYVETSLLDMYVKNDSLSKARLIFEHMREKNIVAWNSLISGYSVKGLFDEAKVLISQMQKEGIRPDLVTWNSLVSGYSMRGYIQEASAVIDEIKSSGLEPNVVTWTAIVSGCSKNGKFRESLEAFVLMRKGGIEPNSVTLASLLKTCGGLSLSQKGREIHCFCTKNGFIDDDFIVTALIVMYSKSGYLKSAHEVFKKSKKTLASWNCIIMAFAVHNHGNEAVSLFNEMLAARLKPDSITFTALLSGCKNSGLVDEGWKYFDSMSEDYGLEPTIEHYSCMVDLLGRAGFLDEAWDLIETMPLDPDASIWGAFLGSCRIHGNIQYAQIAAKKLFKLEPCNAANYVMMQNIYAASNRWEDVDQIKDLMNDRGVKKGHVWSWIQLGNTVHLFLAGGRPHQDEGEIYFELYQIVSEMKKHGYVADTRSMHQNIDDTEKEKLLLGHTEKLAITYGFIKMRNNAPIRVIKNTRMCTDCHTVAKFMSVLRNREIFVRDGVRFHHFKEGQCSCKDYW